MESCLCKVRDCVFGFAYHKTLQYYSGVLGVTLSLRGSSIPTDGSGRIIITDINPDGDNNDDALICLSEVPISNGGDWFLHPTHQMTQHTTDESDRIENNDPRGWLRNRATVTISGSKILQLVRLRRDDSAASEGRALEGVFTCDIPGDSNTPVSVGIYYPSESHIQSLMFTTEIMHYTFVIHLFSNVFLYNIICV